MLDEIWALLQDGFASFGSRLISLGLLFMKLDAGCSMWLLKVFLFFSLSLSLGLCRVIPYIKSYAFGEGYFSYTSGRLNISQTNEILEKAMDRRAGYSQTHDICEHDWVCRCHQMEDRPIEKKYSYP